MTKLAGVISAFIEQMGWDAEVTENETQGTARTMTRARVANQSCRIYVDADDAALMISVYFYLPFHARMDKIEQACVLVNEINRRVRFGHLELDPDDGELRMVRALDAEHSPPTADVVRKASDCIASTLETWMWALAEVAMTDRGARQIMAEDAQRDAASADAKAADDDVDAPTSGARSRGVQTLH